MEYGRLDSVEGVDFTLPPDPFDPVALWGGKPHPAPEIHVAAPSWGIKTWVGKIYPPKTPQRLFLHHYARQFSAIEHNATRYSIPPVERVKEWVSQVPPGFLFCPKFPEQITHLKQLKNCQYETELFVNNIQHFGEHLGTTLLLVHPNLSTNHLGKLLDFLQMVAGKLPLTLELRHPSWYQGGSEWTTLKQFLQEHSISLTVTDVAGLRHTTHMQMLGPEAFIRWTGNELHPSDYTRLDEWAQRLAYWLKMGLPKVYFFIHEPEKTLCPEACDYLAQRLSEASGLAVHRPTFYTSPTLF